MSGFNPASLFGPADDGWYWQPSLDTLYTTSAGSVPATVGDAFGLQLDRSKGLVLGPELWVHASAVTFGESTIVSPNVYRILSTDGENSGIVIFDALVIGLDYEVTFTVDSIAVGGTGIRIGDFGPVVNSIGNFRFRFRADSASQFIKRRDSACDYTISSVSFRLLPGNHAVQATAAARMILRQAANGSYYYESDTTDDFLQTSMSLTSKRMTVAMAFRPLARNFILLGNAGVSAPWAGVGHSGSGITSFVQTNVTLNSLYFDNVLFTGTTRGALYTAAQSAKSAIIDFTTDATSWAAPSIGKYFDGPYYTPGDTFATLLIDREITATDRANITASFMALVP